MWSELLTFFRRPAGDSNLLTEFEDSLMLIVDPEQLTNNLLGKLKELMDVEKAFVYIAERSESFLTFSLVDTAGQGESQLPGLAANGIIGQWFRTNRQILFFEENKEITNYMRVELAVFGFVRKSRFPPYFNGQADWHSVSSSKSGAIEQRSDCKLAGTQQTGQPGL